MASDISKNRIWEIDALRGIAILAVCILHVFSFANTFSDLNFPISAFFRFLAHYGGAVFIFLSGVCVSFSHSSLKRGAVVFACGLFQSLWTYLVYSMGYETEEILMQWNILELIGLCMILYPLFKGLPRSFVIILSAVIIVCGLYITENVYVQNPYLFILGFRTKTFIAFEWRPILPNMGWFMLGSALGPVVYRKKVSKWPKITEKTPVVNVLCFLGRHSLLIYTVQMPVYYFTVKVLLRHP